MIALRIEFTSGRFHATPWGHHANEGQVEWPPSPWRIGRALAAAAFARWGDVPETARSLCVTLASGRPEYVLPPSTEAHTRHYMPSGKTTAKVLDAFRAFGVKRATVRVVWPDVTLADDELAALRTLLPSCSYLGRAESWAEWSEDTSDVSEVNAWPLAADEADPTAADIACLASDESVGSWRSDFLPTGGKTGTAPADRWAALVFDTATLHQGRWSTPPGLSLVRYAVRPPKARRTRSRPSRPQSRPTAAVFVVNSKVLPLQGHALSLGESVRRALLARSEGHAVFSGKDEQGRPLSGNRHAYIVPCCTHEASGGVDRIAVWCRDGLPAEVHGAITGLTWLRRTDGRGARDEERLQLSCIGLGDATHFGTQLAAPDSPRLRQLGTSQIWESVSPFVCFRHPKMRRGEWVDSPEDQVRRALEQLHPTAELDRVEPLFEHDNDEVRWARAFYRRRSRGGGSRGPSRGYAFRLVLRSPIEGPILLGYGAHMGLGQFAAMPKS